MAEKINIATKSGGDTLTSGELNNIVEITNAAIEELNTTKTDHAAAIAEKVEKVPGKGLSTEDFTSAAKSLFEVMAGAADCDGETIELDANTLVVDLSF